MTSNINALRQKLEHDKSDRESWLALGELLTEKNEDTEALACFRAAQNLGENSLVLHRSMGDILLDGGQPQEALTCYQRAREIKPQSAPTLALIGEALCALRRPNEAISYFRKALDIDPGMSPALWSLASAYLMTGDYATGLALYERRFEFDSREFLAALGILPTREYFAAIPAWDGSDLAGRVIAVWTEQGMGDMIMMMRYLPLLKQKGARSVTVFCHDALLQIIRPLVDRAISLREVSLAGVDIQCSAMSLPYLFASRVDTVPNAIPYLQVDSSKTEAWRARLGKDRSLKVGLVWAGNKTMRKDYLRSVPLAVMEPLLKTPGVHFISLQIGASAEIATSGMKITDWMQEVRDYADTAALIANLDLVISVDTAVAHLAGALGVPVWLLNRFESEWRWLAEGRHSPWYPRTRIFRQASLHHWQPVVASVARELQQLVEQRGSRRSEGNSGLLGKLAGIFKTERGQKKLSS